MATLIRGGTVVNHDWSRRADVLVDGSTITVDASSARTRDAAGASTSIRPASNRRPSTSTAPVAM